MKRLAVLLALLVAAPAAAAPASREAALRQWAAILNAEQVPSGWTGATAGCVRGAESAASIQATLTAVNDLRDFAGLAPVTFDPAKNDQALAAALMMDAAGELSHSPGPTWPCYTDAGKDAAGSSNLFLGSTGATAMVGYVDDSGVDSLGHRRWVLDPGATVFGTGSTARANALWVFPPEGSTPPPLPAYVAWPPPGWLPWDLVFGTWSVSIPGADVSAAVVTVTVDGQPRTVTNLRTVDPGFGSADPTLAWNVALQPADRTGDHDVAVSVSGPAPVSYTIHAFAAPPPAISGIGYTIKRGLRPGGKIIVQATITNATSTSYQWLRGHSAIAGATHHSYRLHKADRGTHLRCRITATGISTITRLTPRLKIKRR